MSAAQGPQDIIRRSGRPTLIRKTIAARTFRFELLLAEHTRSGAVTPSLLVGTRTPNSRICSLFTISNTRAATCVAGELPLTSEHRALLARAIALVEPDGIEPTTSCLQSTRSPN